MRPPRGTRHYKTQESNLYGYQGAESLLPYMVLLPIGASLVASVITARWFILDLFHPQASTPSDVLGLLASTLFLLFFGCMFLPFLTMYPSLRVSAKGLSVQIFMFWWLDVPWEDVLDVRSTISPISRSSLVIVRKLTLIHRCIGIIADPTLHPAFLVKPTLTGYDQVLRTIREFAEGATGR